MKTILVPTDFSETAANAVDYAADLAMNTGATIILFNVFQIPMAPAEAPVIIPIDDLEKSAMTALHNVADRLKGKYNDKLTVVSDCRSGFTAEEIDIYAKSCNADLIVMGMQGGGYFTEKVIGSTTTSLISKTGFPVMVIDRNVKFRKILRVALACDFHEMKNRTSLDTVKDFAAIFNSHVYIVNVVSPEEPVVTVTQAVSGIKLDHALETVNHSFHQSVNSDVINGINEFVEKEKIDMVVMVSEKHSIFESFFNEPHTRQMAFHSKVPLLAVHD